MRRLDRREGEPAPVILCTVAHERRGKTARLLLGKHARGQVGDADLPAGRRDSHDGLGFVDAADAPVQHVDRDRRADRRAKRHKQQHEQQPRLAQAHGQLGWQGRSHKPHEPQRVAFGVQVVEAVSQDFEIRIAFLDFGGQAQPLLEHAGIIGLLALKLRERVPDVGLDCQFAIDVGLQAHLEVVENGLVKLVLAPLQPFGDFPQLGSKILVCRVARAQTQHLLRDGFLARDDLCAQGRQPIVGQTHVEQRPSEVRRDFLLPDKRIERDLGFAALDLSPREALARLHQHAVKRVLLPLDKRRDPELLGEDQALGFELLDFGAKAHFCVADHLKALGGSIDLLGLGRFKE